MKYIDILKSNYLSSLRESVTIHEQESKSIHNSIIKWMMKNPYPKDEAVHKFAESMGIEHDKFEEHIYMILSDILTGGKSRNFKGQYSPKELSMGIDIEKEHTKEPLVAEKIAKDHLAEIPDYYTRLKKMERDAEE